MITVAIIGAGPLGRWLAGAAARAGFRTLLEDVMPSNLLHARESLAAQSEGASIVFVSSIEDAVRDADLVIDCVPDELESKLEILWLLDRMAPPRTVIATPTTQLEIADLAGCTYRPEKCIAIAVDPRDFAHLTSGGSISLKSTPKTAPEALALVRHFWRLLGFDAEVS